MSAAGQAAWGGPVARVWEQVCRYCDGIAVGSTLVALERVGVIEHLLGADSVRLGNLGDRFAANPGPLQVGLRLLACQGWLRLHGEMGSPDLEVAVTEAGAGALPHAASFANAVEALVAFEGLQASLLGTASTPGSPQSSGSSSPRSIDGSRPPGGAPRATLGWQDLDERMAAEWALATTIRQPIRRQLLHQLDGHVIVPLMHLLAESGSLPTPLLAAVQPAAAAIETGGWRGAGRERRAALAILRRQGWLAGHASDLDAEARLRREGVVAAGHARQFAYPMCYRPLLLQVPKLLFGDVAEALGRNAADDEQHVDRRLDIRISGGVLTGACRDAFLAAALPLFDRLPLEEQPTAVVDTGSGDGSLLAQLWRAVRDRSRRGRYLAERPLLMVGVELNRIAREATAATLAAAGVPHCILGGDIGEPEAIARSLAAIGVDPASVLHVSKSVIHNRGYSGVATRPGTSTARGEAMTPPGRRALAAAAATAGDRSAEVDSLQSSPLPRSRAAFASPDGQALASELVVTDLRNHLAAWRRVAGRHGMIVIETHTVVPDVVAAHLGRCFQTVVDATHGYSCQYQVEPEVFAAAAAAAGWDALAHHDLGRETVGHVFMTVDRFIADGVA